MRPEAKVQRRGDRSAPDFSWLFASSAMYLASLREMTREKRNHIRHHQPQKPTVRESGVAPPTLFATSSIPLASAFNASTSQQITPAQRNTNLAPLARTSPLSGRTPGITTWR